MLLPWQWRDGLHGPIDDDFVGKPVVDDALVVPGLAPLDPLQRPVDLKLLVASRGKGQVRLGFPSAVHQVQLVCTAGAR